MSGSAALQRKPPVFYSSFLLDTVFGSMANYLCLPGYEIHGIEDLLCTWTGSWDRYPPECLPVDCGQPPEVANGVTIGKFHINTGLFDAGVSIGDGSL